MKHILAAGTFVAILLSGAVVAQDPSASTTDSNALRSQTAPVQNQAQQSPAIPSQTNSLKIAPGSVIPVQLTKTVDAKKVKTGDEVVAKVTMDMKTNTGEVVVPKDTKIVGRITAAQARNKEQKESQLAIAFDQAYVKNQQVTLPMSIQAVIGQENNNEAQNNAPGGNTPSPSGTGTSASSPMSGRAPTAGPPQNSGAPDTDDGGGQSEPSKRPPINGQTQGVVGISNLNLSPNSNGAQGSTLTSEKNNVKLESGTMLLLRVNQ